MSDWTDAAIETAKRTAQDAAPSPGAGTTVRVSAATKAELDRRQRVFAAAHPGASISADGIIAGLLAGQPVQP